MQDTNVSINNKINYPKSKLNLLKFFNCFSPFAKKSAPSLPKKLLLIYKVKYHYYRERD